MLILVLLVFKTCFYPPPRVSDPEPPPPHFSSLAVRATLDYIASCYGDSTATSAGHASFTKQLTRKQV